MLFRDELLSPGWDKETHWVSIRVEEEGVEGGTGDTDVVESGASVCGVESVGGVNEEHAFRFISLEKLLHGVNRCLTATFKASADLKASSRFLDIRLKCFHSSLCDKASQGFADTNRPDVRDALREKHLNCAANNGMSGSESTISAHSLRVTRATASQRSEFPM